MSIAIQPNVPLVAAQGVTAPVVLQPGSVISARVQQLLGNDTVRIAIGGQSLDVQSQVPLQAGQTLQLAVSQTQDGIGLAVVSQQGGAAASQGATDPAGTAAISDSVTLAPDAAATIATQPPPTAASRIVLTPPEAAAVSLAVQSAAAQQTSLAQLFSNLGVAAGLDSLPPQVQQAVAQVLAQRTSLDSGLTGSDINQAFQSSGLFLEASLASGALPPSAAPPDLKAALIVLRQVLSTSISATLTTPSAPAATSALATPSALVAQGAPTSAVAGQPGVATAPAGQSIATPTAAAIPGATTATPVQQAATVAAALAQGVVASAAPQVAGPVAAAIAAALLQPGAPSAAELLSQPVIITAGPTAPDVASPALAPLLAAATSVATALPQGTSAPVASGLITPNLANPVTAPASSLADAAARAATSSAALTLLQEAVQALPLTAANTSVLLFENSQMLSLIPLAAGARPPEEIDDAEMARNHVPPPPLSGALPAAQPVVPATLVSNSSAQASMHRLLADTEAAIARQTLLQVASLPGQTDTAAARLDPTAPRWNFEIPFVTPQGTAMAQFEISRDGENSQVDAAKRVWRARFTIDVEPAGPVHALVSLSGDRTSVRIWAERPATAAQLRAGAAQLSLALSRAELQPGDIVVREGAPSQAAPARAGHFLDRAS